MCKYQRVYEGKAPICLGTNQLCTYCVNGNMQTYKENEKKQIPEINGQYKKQTTAGTGLY